MSIASATDPGKSSLAQDFDQIYREHARFVFRTAYGITGNRQDAEDVLQAVIPEVDFQGNSSG
jgi:DNA-directed RNA polymerase specialized sigma24 family protein